MVIYIFLLLWLWYICTIVHKNLDVKFQFLLLMISLVTNIPTYSTRRENIQAADDLKITKQELNHTC